VIRPPGNDDIRVTPEAVALRIDIAGLGSRFVATVVDTLLQAAITGVLALAAGPGLSALGVSENVAFPTVIAVVTIAVLGYFPAFEILMRGKTPGKRAQHLRVVHVDGQPARAGSILLRNLVRIVDFLPGSYLIGALSIFFSKRSQRLGDLVAGTIVIRERRQELPAAPELPPRQGMGALPDTSALTERDYAAVRAFLQRRGTLDRDARRHLAEKLVITLGSRIGGKQQGGPEEFLESIAQSYRERFSGR